MVKIDFCDKWIFCKAGEDSSAKTVMLPHDAMLAENRGRDNAGGTNTGWFEGCDYVYRKDFEIPQEHRDKNIVFEFEGVYKDAAVFINGIQAGYHPYGYTGFYISAGEYIKLDSSNEIVVKVKNSDQPNSRWYTGAGIYRPVFLHALPKSHILLDGIKIRTLSVNPPKIEISVGTSCGGKITAEILDGGKVIAAQSAETGGAVTMEMSLPDCALWSAENPRLYVCRVGFEDDICETTFGIREILCDNTGFYLNGKRTLLLGACIHHDNGVLGAAAHPCAEFRKVRILKENGYNAIRSAHNPCSKALLDACDRLGMLIIDEYVDMWYIHKTRYDYAEHFEKNWKQDLRAISDKDFNHPSVVMYSVGNEVAETAQEKGIRLCGEMTEFLHSIDYRPVTCGLNTFFNYLSSMGFGVYSDKKANKKAPKKKKKAVGSEFFNNLAGIFGDDTMKFGATLGGSDRRTRDAFARLDVAGYNYGILRYKKDAKKYPDRVILGSETFCRDAYKFWELAKRIPALIGDFVWTGMDYIGEVGLGAWEYKDYAKSFLHDENWLTSGCGRIDITGRPLGEMAYTRVAFDLDKIRMAVIPADNASKKHSPSAWKMTNAFESWAWEGCDGKKTKVEVYSKAHRVVLFINGKKVGEKRFRKDCRFVFRVKYISGEITALAFDESGKETASITLKSAGNETRLVIIPDKPSVNRGELVFVRLKYVDENGELKPLARGDIKVSVENGTLLGLGNACPYNAAGYLSDTTDTYYGEALAVIKPAAADAVRIKAESKFGECETEVNA